MKIGDAINTDYGSARVAELRDGEDGPEVGFLVDGNMAWVAAEDVTPI